MSGTAEVLSPSAPGDELADLAGALAGWEEAYREWAGLGPPPPRKHLTLPVCGCIGWLGAQLPSILSASSPIAEDFGKEVLAWQRGFTRRVKAGIEPRTLPLRCQPPAGCRWRSLIRVEGTDRIACQNPACGRTISYVAYLAEVEAAAAAVQRGAGHPAA